jgi:ribosome-binding protein aMBF1 (putative translation factor)
MKLAWVCSRCGQKRTAVMDIQGKLVCSDCLQIGTPSGRSREPSTKRSKRRTRGKAREKPKRVDGVAGRHTISAIENVMGRIS